MRKGISTVLVLATVLSMNLASTAAFSQPQYEPVLPDPVAAANNFITGLTGNSPAALGIAGDAQDLAAIGQAVLEGDFAAAANRLGEFTAGKVIGAAAPGIGQLIAIGNVGKMLGDYTMDWLGNRNFNKIYDTMVNDFLGPVETWPKTREEARRRPGFKEGMAASYSFFETWLIERGYADSVEEAGIVAEEMIIAKGNFERLCNEYGLEGNKRTYENLYREIQIEAEVAAEIAREKEIARAERLEQERLEREKAAQQEADLEAELEKEMAALEKEKKQTEAEKAQAEPKPEKPGAPRPDGAVVVETKPEPSPKPASTPEKPQPERLLVWEIAPTAGEGQTVFAVTVTNLSDRPVTGFSCSIAPAGPYSEGGVGWGTSPSFSTIGPKDSVSFTALAMGDVEGLVFSFWGNGKTLGSDRVSSVHAVEKKPVTAQKPEALVKSDGNVYEGEVKGGPFKSKLGFVISNGVVSGTFKGDYADPFRKASVEASISGTFDPSTGEIFADWTGTADVVPTAIGKAYDIKEGKQSISGELSGALEGQAFSGKWRGMIGDVSGGTWQAERVGQ